MILQLMTKIDYLNKSQELNEKDDYQKYVIEKKIQDKDEEIKSLKKWDARSIITIRQCIRSCTTY